MYLLFNFPWLLNLQIDTVFLIEQSDIYLFYLIEQLDSCLCSVYFLNGRWVYLSKSLLELLKMFLSSDTCCIFICIKLSDAIIKCKSLSVICFLEFWGALFPSVSYSFYLSQRGYICCMPYTYLGEDGQPLKLPSPWWWQASSFPMTLDTTKPHAFDDTQTWAISRQFYESVAHVMMILWCQKWTHRSVTAYISCFFLSLVHHCSYLKTFSSTSSIILTLKTSPVRYRKKTSSLQLLKIFHLTGIFSFLLYSTTQYSALLTPCCRFTYRNLVATLHTVSLPHSKRHRALSLEVYLTSKTTKRRSNESLISKTSLQSVDILNLLAWRTTPSLNNTASTS